MSNFRSFRELTSTWDAYCFKEDKKKEQKHAQKQAKVKNIIDGQNLIIFFKKGSRIFGAPEESRIVFARMKHPTEDEPIPDDANFSAFDLIQALSGNAAENLFALPDVATLDIITRDQAEDHLMKCPDEGPPSTLKLSPTKDKDIGTIDLKDKE